MGYLCWWDDLFTTGSPKSTFVLTYLIKHIMLNSFTEAIYILITVNLSHYISILMIWQHNCVWAPCGSWMAYWSVLRFFLFLCLLDQLLGKPHISQESLYSLINVQCLHVHEEPADAWLTSCMSTSPDAAASPDEGPMEIL